MSLAIALAYLGTLGFVVYLVERRDRNQVDVHDKIDQALQRLDAIDKQRDGWNAAASYVEAKNVERGLKIGR